MGSPPGELGRDPSSEGPVDTTISRGFWLGRFEVSHAEWEQVMGQTLVQQRAKAPIEVMTEPPGAVRKPIAEGPEHPILFRQP